MIRLSFAMALPFDHPERAEESLTRRLFEAFRAEVSSSKHPDWAVRYLEVATFDDTEAAVRSMTLQAISLSDRSPGAWLVCMLALPWEQCTTDWMRQVLRQTPKSMILVPVTRQGVAVPARSRIGALPPLGEQPIEAQYYLAKWEELMM